MEMSFELKDYIYELLSQLSFEERKEILAHLESMEFSAATLKEIDDKVKEKRFNDGFFCPHCHSKNVVRNGHCGARQRFRCKSCEKAFTDLAGTPLHRIRYKDKLFRSLRCMLEGYSLPRTAKEVGVSIPTAFYWRHKILGALRHFKDEQLSGIVEADDTYLRYSEKGDRDLERLPRKRGSKAKRPGINEEQVCVMVARDRNDNTVSEVVTQGRPSAKELAAVLGDNILQGSVLCIDKHPSLRKFARLQGFACQQLNRSQNMRVVKGLYHIQNVNAYHSRFKTWLRRFNGVSTQYLSNYLHWFEFIDRIGEGKISPVAQRDLLLKACTVDAA